MKYDFHFPTKLKTARSTVHGFITLYAREKLIYSSKA